MSIYNNTEEYAKQTFMSLEQSEIRCKYFRKIQQKMHESKRCSKCGQHTLEIESGSYEEGTQDFVYCENDKVSVIDEYGEKYLTDCDFTSDVDKEYEPVNHWYDFDEVLAFSIDFESNGKEMVEKHIGCSWDEFINESNKKLTT